MLLNYIHWSVSPEVFPGTWLPVRWYGLLFASGFFFGYLIMTKFFKHENLPIKLLDELATYMVIATVVGARLGHVLFYGPYFDVLDTTGRVLDEGYFSHPFNIFKIWEGGLASHGAAIGILAALWFFAKKNNKTYFWTLDRIVIVVALAGFFIRMGNLMNSEIFGKPTTLPWAFIFVNEDKYLLPRHPTQIYEGLSYLAIFVILYIYYWKTNGKPRPGLIFGVFLVLLFAMRFLVEFLKEPQVTFENTMPLNMGQLLSIPFIIAGLIIIFKKQETTKYIESRPNKK